ncbi:MAG TPA: methyltransferase domain-containing protein [Vicinamibacterales bacterium]|nr:methyltransferase domain-containing protein [Vicinamibacterales bacterium]
MGLRGYLQAARVSRPVNVVRYHVYRDVLLAYPKRHACNICGWGGRHFLTYYHRHVLCPSCGSQIRHRLLAQALGPKGPAASLALDGARVLHISPEYCLSLIFKPRASQYVRADYATPDCDIRVDITDMSAISRGSFDIVIACDVLEHVRDDLAAMREVHRVLRPGGTAILSVPQFDGDEPTLEAPSVDSPEARQRLYGQTDHERNYGSDFGDRLRDAGFIVRIFDAGSFPHEAVRAYVLEPPVPLPAAYGWNRRRVYFASTAEAA